MGNGRNKMVPNPQVITGREKEIGMGGGWETKTKVHIL
jgi:hypothetical protein